jgi:hypothetical protein
MRRDRRRRSQRCAAAVLIVVMSLAGAAITFGAVTAAGSVDTRAISRLAR